MELRGITSLLYELTRVKEDRIVMGWEDERSSTLAKFEKLKASNAAQAAEILRQREEYENLLRTISGFQKATSPAPGGRNFLANITNIPKVVRPKAKEVSIPTPNKRPREHNADDEPDFISIDRSKASKKGPMDSFFGVGTAAASASSDASKSSKIVKNKHTDDENTNETNKKQTKTPKTPKVVNHCDDAWMFTQDEVLAKDGSGSKNGNQTIQENGVSSGLSATSSATTEVVNPVVPRAYPLVYGGANGAIEQINEAAEEMDTQWLALSGNPVAAEPTTMASLTTKPNITNIFHSTTYDDHLPDFAAATTPYLPRTSILTDVATASSDKLNRSIIIRDNPLFPYSQAEDDDVTVAGPSQENENPSLSQDLLAPVEVEESVMLCKDGKKDGTEQIRAEQEENEVVHGFRNDGLFPDSQATCASAHIPTIMPSIDLLSTNTNATISTACGLLSGTAMSGNTLFNSGVFTKNRPSLSLLHVSPSQTQSQLYSQDLLVPPQQTIIEQQNMLLQGGEDETNAEDDLFVEMQCQPARGAAEMKKTVSKEEIIDLSHSPKKENRMPPPETKPNSMHSNSRKSTLPTIANAKSPTSANKLSTYSILKAAAASTTPYHTTHTNKGDISIDRTSITPYNTAITDRTTTPYDSTTAANAAANRLVVSFTDTSPELANNDGYNENNGGIDNIDEGDADKDNHSVFNAHIDRLTTSNTMQNRIATTVTKGSKSDKHSAKNKKDTPSKGRTSAKPIPAASHKADTNVTTANPNKQRELLSKKRQGLLTDWLREYRKKWTVFWNHLPDSMITDIVRTVPVTMQELTSLPGMNTTRAQQDGEGILCTIYAFLEHHDVIHLFPHATLPILAECPTWRNPFSVEADRIRHGIVGNNNVGSSGGASNLPVVDEEATYDPQYDIPGVPSAAPVNSGVNKNTTSSTTTNPGNRSSNGSSTSSTIANKPSKSTTKSTNNRPLAATATAATTAGAHAGASKSTYNTAKCIETVRSREQRAALPGYTCEECTRFYETMQQQGIMCMTDSQMRREVLQACSRHKARWTPPSTPEGFWGLTLHTPDDWK